jgi:hypothetical protein
VFLLIRALFIELSLMNETELPLIKPESLFKENDKLDLSKTKKYLFKKTVRFFFKDNGDLIACTVHMKERFELKFND